MGTTGGAGGDNGVDSGQLFLVAICAVGLVAAAFLAPVVGANDLVGTGGNGSLDDNQGRDDSPGEPRGGERVTVERDDGSGEVEAVEREDGPGVDIGRQDGCFVAVESDPKPGTEASVLVTVDGSPTSDVRVWFNDRYVGRTDDSGLARGTVPFATELDVTVESPTDEPCRFSRQDPADIEQSGVVGAGVGAAAGGGVVSLRQEAGPGGVNNSSQYTVASDVDIRVTGDAIPGTTVTLVSSVEGAPMANATVAVDGEEVGQTDGDGRYQMTVPDSDSVEVTVSRGEISGSRTIETLDLSVAFVPKLLVPGERATVSVTRGGAPVENATVTLGGQTLGATDSNGRLSFELPFSADGTVRAETSLQSATIPLLLAYWLTGGVALLLSVLTTGTTLLAAHWRGRGTAKRVASVWGGIWALFVGYAVGERLGLAIVGGVVLLVGLYRYRQTVQSGGATAAEMVVAFVEWCRTMALTAVSGLESLSDWLRAGAQRVGAWLRSLPTSLSGLAARLGAWLRALPSRVADSVRSLPLRAVTAAVVALGGVAAATYAFGGRGFLVSVAVVVVAAIAWWLRRREPTGPSVSGDSEPSEAGTVQSTDAPSVPTLRQLWRRLASWVLPGRWQTKTPAEISRAAVEQGFPRGPVESLAEAFRDVEYGGQPEEGRQEQARAAVEALEHHRDTEEGDR